jgi:diguanylate cyclase (GGDEF)-like protein/PAS domain S-box-containing protein
MFVIIEPARAPRSELELVHLAAIVDASRDPIITKTTEGVITAWNPAAQRLYGYSAEEAVGQHISLVVPVDRRDELQKILDDVAAGKATEDLETFRARKDGTLIQVVLNVRPLLGARGEVLGASTVTHDVTAEALAISAREAAEMLFQAAFRASGFGMVIADLDGTPTSVNPALCELLGRRAEDVVAHRWGYYAHPDDAPLITAMLGELDHGSGSYSGEQRFVRADGAILWLQVNVTVVRDSTDKATYLMAQVQDVTDRKRIEDEMAHRALHDELTGLPNRALLNDRLDHALAASARTDSRVGVVFLDIDDFKHVNDALGHGVGDRLLVEVGRRLRASVRPADTVARFGGDEFVVVCDDVGPSSMAGLASRVAQALRAPFTVQRRRIPLRASLGITLSRADSYAQSLLSEADAAMYRAKELGRGRWAFFDESLRARAEAMLGAEPVGLEGPGGRL